MGPRGKKCIFIRYSGQSKGYIFIGKHDDESVTKLESRNVDFLEKDFPKINEIKEPEPLFEIMDSENGIVPHGSVEMDYNTLSLDPSGNNSTDPSISIEIVLRSC